MVIHDAWHDNGAMSRRVEARYPVSEIAKTRSLVAPQEGTNPTQVVDVSNSGLRMESNQAFLPGEEIAIRVNKLVTFGVVRYCRELRPGCFSVGVSVRDIVARPTQERTGLAEMLVTGEGRERQIPGQRRRTGLRSKAGQPVQP